MAGKLGLLKALAKIGRSARDLENANPELYLGTRSRYAIPEYRNLNDNIDAWRDSQVAGFRKSDFGKDGWKEWGQEFTDAYDNSMKSYADINRSLLGKVGIPDGKHGEFPGIGKEVHWTDPDFSVMRNGRAPSLEEIDSNPLDYVDYVDDVRPSLSDFIRRRARKAVIGD